MNYARFNNKLYLFLRYLSNQQNSAHESFHERYLRFLYFLPLTSNPVRGICCNKYLWQGQYISCMDDVRIGKFVCLCNFHPFISVSVRSHSNFPKAVSADYGIRFCFRLFDC